jgi:hypothetical protein
MDRVGRVQSCPGRVGVPEGNSLDADRDVVVMAQTGGVHGEVEAERSRAWRNQRVALRSRWGRRSSRLAALRPTRLQRSRGLPDDGAAQEGGADRLGAVWRGEDRMGARGLGRDTEEVASSGAFRAQSRSRTSMARSTEPLIDGRSRLWCGAARSRGQGR